MKSSTVLDAEPLILGRLSALCLVLPETERIERGRHAKFVIRRRTFAYFLDDHHGDGVVGAAFKAAWGENEELSHSFPARFYVPPYIGAKGWVGVRLDRKEVDWDEVGELAKASYRLVAPKKFVSEMS